MDKKEAIELIREEVVEKGTSPEYYDYEDPTSGDLHKLHKAGFKIEKVEQEGDENERSAYHVVLKLDDGKEPFYVKCDAVYYASYFGTEWEGGEVYEVQKKKVEVEQWVKTE